jgi:hypothetical protein
VVSEEFLMAFSGFDDCPLPGLSGWPFCQGWCSRSLLAGIHFLRYPDCVCSHLSGQARPASPNLRADSEGFRRSHDDRPSVGGPISEGQSVAAEWFARKASDPTSRSWETSRTTPISPTLEISCNIRSTQAARTGRFASRSNCGIRRLAFVGRTISALTRRPSRGVSLDIMSR